MELTLDQALQKGIEAHQAGKFQEADLYYSAILKAQPQHPDANHNMGVLAVGVGKVEAALPFFETALNANPKKEQFWLSYIDTLIKLHRIDDAEAVLEQAKSKGAKGDHFDELSARLGLSNAKNSNDQDPTQEQLQGLINLHKKGCYQEALKQASQILEQFPNSINLHNIIGAANKRLGKLEEAVSAYRQALAINPDFADAYYNMGIALTAQEKLDEAIEAYKKALSIKPDYAQVYSNMGDTFKAQGKLEEAIEAYKKALTIKPNYAEAHNNMGNAIKEQGKLGEAIEAYKRALTIMPNFAEAHNNMGTALQKQGKLEEAIEAYNKAISSRPDFTEVYHNMGNAFNDQGNLKKAIEAFDKDNSQGSRAKALENIYELGNYLDFNERLSILSKEDPNNIRVAAMSAFASDQLKQENVYPFCKDPLDMVHTNNIKNYMPNFDEFITSLLNEMNELRASWEPGGKTTKGGFQTNGKLFSNNSPNLTILEDIIKKELISYKLKFMNYDLRIIQNWPEKIELNAWYVRLLKGGHQSSHIHPGGWVSGVFYLKTVPSPRNQEGAIKFGLHGYEYPIKNEKLPFKIHQPVNGDLVLFPSSLFHETIPVKQELERCVIAFDLKN